MWATSPPELTAEWECTRCGTVNRKLLPLRAREGADKCMHCGLRHQITVGATPVRWDAKAR